MEIINRALAATSYLGEVNYLLIILEMLLFVAFVLGFFISLRSKRKYRFIGIVVFFILIVRSAFFINPLAWFFYYKTLSVEDVSYRQESVIAYESRKYFKPAEPVKYLAMGSSQTSAIFADQAKQRSDLFESSLYDMGPIDYYLYRDTLKRINPQTVLLQLSLFDLGRSPDYSLLRYAPGGIDNIFGYTQSISDKQGSGLEFNQLAWYFASYISLEYKYSYIINAYKNRVAGAPQFSLDLRKDAYGSVVTDTIEQQVENIQNGFTLDYIDLNFYAINEFIKYCKDNGIKVVIAHGQYNPVVINDRSNEMELEVKKKLMALATRYDNTQYISLDKLKVFNEEDYIDAYHVNKDAAYFYVDNLLKQL